MFPMQFSTIFKNRWWALIWAAGIIWAAYDIVGSEPQGQDGNNSVATDATGSPITSDDENRIAHALKD